MTAHQPVAVFDLGKTNSKLFVIDGDGNVIAERRTKPVWRVHGDIRVLDDAALFAWMENELAQSVEAHGVRHVTFSGHGCTFALIGDKHASPSHPRLQSRSRPHRLPTGSTP